MCRCFSGFTAREDTKAGDRVRQGDFEAPVFMCSERASWFSGFSLVPVNTPRCHQLVPSPEF